jgi:tetratricopeptide (TPR) repeat protein
MKRLSNTIVLTISILSVALCCSCTKEKYVWYKANFGWYLTAGYDAHKKGDYAKAEKHYKAALAIAEQGGLPYDLVALVLDCLGDNYEEQGKYTEAEAAYKRELSVVEKALGPSHPDLLDPLTSITLLYLKQSRDNEAETYNQRALAIASGVTDDKYKSTISTVYIQRDIIAGRKDLQPK